MAEWNPNAPTVLGLEWFPTVVASEPVDAGPAWVQRLPSLAAETVEATAMSATGSPGQNGILHTLVEIIPEGDENPGPVQTIDLFPSGDGDIGDWTTDTGSTTDLYQALQDPFVWPNLPPEPYIQTLSGFDSATFDVDTASTFGPAGPLENARICRVQLGLVIASITDPPRFLTLGFAMEHNGTDLYPPGSASRDANIFGEAHFIASGELNPATVLPWTPADLAEFDVGGDWRIWCASSFVADGHPAVISFGLRVNYIPVENRSAVGVWTRTSPPPAGIFDVETDQLVSMPDGTANWAKPDATNFLYVWRQARSPFLHSGQSLAKDTRWLRAYQDLGPEGNPPGLSPAPGLRADRLTFDEFGLPTSDFDAGFISAAAITPLLAGGVASEDGQPYRLTLLEFEPISAGNTVGQAVTPAVAANYAGARTVVVPPASGAGTLTITVHQVGGPQVGGSVSWTAEEVRAVPKSGATAQHYIEGFFDTPVPLSMGVQYEIRLTATGDWLATMPNAGIGPEASFGGTTDGAFIGPTMDPDRDVAVALTVAPAEPTDVEAEVVTVCVNNWACVDEVEHVQLSWTPGEPPLGDGFVRYDIDRRLRRIVPDPDTGEPEDGEPGGWRHVVSITDEEAEAWVDREVPRGWKAQYRIRAVADGGASSVWVESNAVVPEAVGCTVIFTSNQCPELEVVYERPPEVDYDFLDHQADVVLPIYGADYQVAFFEPEDRGVAAEFDVIVNFRDLPRDRLGNVIGGKAVFEPLRRITRSTDIPYVVVMDHQGNVWRGHVTLSNGINQEPGNRYTVHVLVTPVTDVPAPAQLPTDDT